MEFVEAAICNYLIIIGSGFSGLQSYGAQRKQQENSLKRGIEFRLCYCEEMLI